MQNLAWFSIQNDTFQNRTNSEASTVQAGPWDVREEQAVPRHSLQSGQAAALHLPASPCPLPEMRYQIQISKIFWSLVQKLLFRKQFIVLTDHRHWWQSKEARRKTLLAFKSLLQRNIKPQQLPFCTCLSVLNFYKQQSVLVLYHKRSIWRLAGYTSPGKGSPLQHSCSWSLCHRQTGTASVPSYSLGWTMVLLFFLLLLKTSLSSHSHEEGGGSSRKPGHQAAKLYIQVIPVQKGNRSSVPLHTLHTCMATEENTAKWLHSNPRNPFRLPQLRKKYQCRKGCVTQQRPKTLICNCKKEFCEVATLVCF